MRMEQHALSQDLRCHCMASMCLASTVPLRPQKQDRLVRVAVHALKRIQRFAMMINLRKCKVQSKERGVLHDCK